MQMTEGWSDSSSFSTTLMLTSRLISLFQPMVSGTIFWTTQLTQSPPFNCSIRQSIPTGDGSTFKKRNEFCPDRKMCASETYILVVLTESRRATTFSAFQPWVTSLQIPGQGGNIAFQINISWVSMSWGCRNHWRIWIYFLCIPCIPWFLYLKFYSYAEVKISRCIRWYPEVHSQLPSIPQSR